MLKDKRGSIRVDFSKIFKKSVAASLAFLILGMQTSYASNITAGGGFGTNVTTDGNNITIDGGTIKGDGTGFHHFGDFNLSQGDIANLLFGGANRFVNLVDGQVRIDGIFNAIKNGAIGGDVIFVSPLGMIVGATGVMNVGSLQTITPVKSSYDSLVGLGGSGISYSDIQNLRSDSKDSETRIDGKIFSSGNINIAESRNLTLGENSLIVSGFNQNGFAKTQTGDLTGIVNAEGIVDASYLTNSGGSVKIVANNIYSDGSDSLIQSMNNVSLDATAKGSLAIGSKIKAGGDVNLGQEGNTGDVIMNGKIDTEGKLGINSSYSVTQGAGADINAGSMAVDTGIIDINGNITTNNGLTVNASNGISQSDDSEIINNTSGDISLISYLSAVNTNKITNKAGDITIGAGDLKMNNTIDAQNGSINITARKSISQKDDSFTSLKAQKDLNIVTTTDVGSASQAVNVNVGGDVDITNNSRTAVYLNSKDADLSIKKITMASNVNLNSGKKITIKQNVNTNGNLNIQAQEGVVQTSDSNIKTTGSGTVNIENGTSGDVVLQNIATANGTIDVTNNASDGRVDINGEITSNNNINVTSQNGINQGSSSTIKLDGTADKNITLTNNGTGDVNLNNITNTGGNITIKNTNGGTLPPTPGSVNLNGLLSANTGSVNIESQGNITQSTDTKSIAAGTDVNLNAQGNIGSKDKHIIASAGGEIIANTVNGAVNLTGDNTSLKLSNISSGTDYDITTTGDGDIIFDKDLTNINGDFSVKTDKDLSIDNIIHAKGNVSVTSNNGDVILNALITSTDESISVSAQGNIYQNDSFDGTTLNAAKDITLTAQTGDVGALAKAIQLESNGSVLVNGGNVYLTSPKSLNIAGINKDKTNPGTVVNVTTTNSTDGNIKFAGLVKGSDVTISAAQGITQNNGIKSVEASGDLSLISKNGSIGETGNAINFSANKVSADSSKSVVLTGIDTDIKTSLIKAKENIDLSTQIVDPGAGKGKITVEDNLITSENGYIRLNSAKSLEINNNLSAGKSITLNANGGITQGAGSTITSGTNASGAEGSGKITISNDGAGSISLGDITSNLGDIEVENKAANENIVLNSVLNAVDSNILLTSAGNIVQNAANAQTALKAGGDITLKAINAGSADKYILTDAGGALNAIVTNIYAEDNTGDLTLGQIDAAGDVYLKADGNIDQTDYTKDAVISFGNVNLTSTNGNIGGGTPDKALVVTGRGKVNADGSNIYLTSTNKLVTGVLNAKNDINVSSKYVGENLELSDNITANGNITLNSAGGISQTGGVIHKAGAGTGNVAITANQGQVSLGEITNDSGNITVTNNTGANNIVLNSVLKALNGDITLSSKGGIEQIGTQTSLVAGNNISLTTNGYSLGTVDQYITLTAGNDVIADSGSGSLFLKAIDTDLKTSNITSNGAIGLNVSGTGNLLVDRDLITNGGFIDIVVDKALNLEHKLSASNYISITTDGAITQDSSLDLALNSGADITLNSNGNDIGADGNSLSIKADGQIDADGNNIYLKTPDANLNAGNINAAGDIKLSTETSGDINLKGLLNGNNITLNAVDGIYQTSADKSISALGALSLTSQKESVGRTGQAINFSADSVSAHAEKSVVLLGVDTDINTASISAKENIDLSTKVTDPSSTKGKITVASDLKTTNGYIKLDSAKSLEINNNLEAGQHITLNANGGIVQNNTSVIKAGTSASAADGSVTITNAGTGNVSLHSVSTGKGDIKVTNSADGADVVLNSLVQASSGSVNIDSKGSVLQTLGGLGIDALNNISINAVNNLGSLTDKITLNAGGDVTAGGANIYLQSPNKTLNLAGITSNGIVDISTVTAGNINIKNQITGSDITLDSAEGIYQTGTDKTITASGKLSLTANNGDLGRDGNALVFKADSVTAKAQNGSVILNGVETDINTGSITAGNNIDLTTTTSGNININEALTSDGYIKLNSADQINVIKDITSTGSYINLSAVNNINLGASINAFSDAVINSKGNILHSAGTITAGNDIAMTAIGNLGALGNEILVNAGNVFNADADNIYVKDTEGGFVLGDITANNNVNLSSVGDMTQSDLSKPAIKTQGDITLVSTTGKIGTASSNSISIDTKGIVNAQASDIYLTSPSDLNTGTITAAPTGTVDVRTTGDGKDIVLKKLMSGGNIILNAKGDVRQDSALNKTINADNLNITAQNGNIGETDNAVDFSVTGTLAANAERGSVVLNGIDTNIFTSSITAGKSIDLSTENTGSIFVQSALNANDGYIRLNSVDGLELNENITASDYIELISQTGDILIDSLINAGTDINLNAKGDINQGTHAGILTAGRDININALGDLGSALNKIKLNAGGDVTAGGANVYLESPNKTLNIAGITSNGIVDIASTTSGDINIKGEITGSDVTLNAHNGIYQDSDTKTITASGDLVLIAQNNDIGRTDNAVIFEAGTVSANAEHGSVVLNGIDTDIYTNSIIAGKNIDLSTTNSGNITIQDGGITANGYIKLDSAESLIVDKNLTSSDYIYLGAKDGLYLSAVVQAATDITMDAQGGITQTTGSVAAASGKVIALNDVSGGITLNNIAAKTGMNISNNGSASAVVTVGGLNSQNGTINIVNSTGGNVVLASLIESTNGNVSVNAVDGNIVQTGTSPVIIAGSDIFLGANEVGSSDKYINTNAGGSVSANGVNIYLENDSSEFRIGNINTNPDIVNETVNIKSNTGDVKFKGLVKGDVINVASAKGIKQDAGLTKSVDANNVNFTANNGNVGEDGNSIDMTVTGAVNVDKSQNVYIHGADTGLENALNVGNINADNNVKLTSDSGIKLNGLIHTTNADLTAVGNITQDSLIAKSIDADSIRLTSTGGDIGETGNAIDFVTRVLYADAANSVVLNGLGVDISTDTINAGKNIDLSTTGSGNITIASDLTANGYIRLNSAESLIVDKTLNAADFVELTAQNGEMILASLIQATDVTLTAAGGITQQSGKIVSTGANGVIATNSQGGGITLNDVSASNGGITITNDVSANGLVTLGTINANGNVSVSNLSNNGIVLNNNLSGADVTMVSTGGVTQNAGTLTSTGTDGVKVTNSKAGGISLNDVSASNGGIAITNDVSANGDVTLGSITAGGNLAVSNLAKKGIILNNTISGADVALTSTGGIVQNNGNILSSGANGVVINNSTAEGIKLNNITASNGGVTIKNDDTADGSVSLGTVTANKNVEVSNLSNNDIVLNSSISGGDIKLTSTGGISQTAGNITSTGANGVTVTNSQAGGIHLNDITASNGAVNLTNDNTAIGSVILGAIDAKNNVSVSNLSEGEIRLNSSVKGADISLVSTGGISQNAGFNITSTGADGVTVSNSASGGIQLNKINAANGGISITNHETAGGSVIVDELTAGKNISIANLSDNQIILNSNVSGADVSLVSTGGIIQQNGNISSNGANGFNAQNSNSGDIELNNITSLNGVNIENTASTASDIVLNAITNTNGLVNIKNSTGGDVLLSALVQSSNGSIVIDTGIGNIEQTIAGLALKAGQDITLKAGDHIGTSTSSIKMNAGRDVYLQGSNLYIDSPDMNLNIAQIKNESGTVNIKTSGTSGSLTINDDITADDIALGAVGVLTSNANIAGQNALALSGASVIQKAGTSISTQNGTLSVNASNGDINLGGNISNTNGDVIIANNSAGNGNVTVNNVNAGTSYSITNKGNGLVTVKGTLTNNADSSISSENTGDSSGLVISDSAVLNNKNGTLSLTNKGQKGTILGGKIYNNFNNGTNVFVSNDKGAFEISADMYNGKSKGDTNILSLVNNGMSADGEGLNIISGTINNYGDLRLLNNKGSMNIGGNINAQLGSINRFINGSDSDMNISMKLDSYGNTMTFENRGTGSLIVGEDAVLSVYSVQDGDTLYKGELNLNNISDAHTTGGGITINGKINNGSASTQGGTVNITNTGNGGADDYGIKIGQTGSINNNAELNIKNLDTTGTANGKISVAGSISGLGGVINITNDAAQGIVFEDGANISTGADLNVVNNKGSLNVEKNANINSSSDINISNNQAGNLLNFKGKVHGKNVNIESNGSNINIAHNKTDANISADSDIKITANNASVLNTADGDTIANAGGIQAGGNIDLKADNIGKDDSSLGNIINDGFVLDPNNSIHVSAGGKVSAVTSGIVNLLTVNGNLNLDNVTGANVILSAINGSIIGNDINSTSNLYAYAKADNGKIDLNNINVTGDIYGEAGSTITLNSLSDTNIQSLLSRNDTINITSEGNTDINEIAAAKDINITVKDEKLTIINLGRVERAQDVIPENVNLTVLDSKRAPTGSYTPGMSPEELEGITPNSKLDIYNAYVQNKATLKADTITAQVYDISEGSAPGQIRVDKNGNQATGFHNANKNGQLLEFDIQGANYAQGDAGSNPPNHFYEPDPNDKRALNVYLTLGDSVGDAVYGARFKKLYSDYAFIDSVNQSDPSAFSKLVLESGIIGEKAIFRNGLLRLDIDNTTTERDYAINKHYDDEPDKVVTNKSSFNMEMYDTIIIDKPYTPDYPQDAASYNPHKRVFNPDLDEKLKPVSASEQDSSAVDSSKSTGYRQINWIIKNKNNEVLGSSDSTETVNPVIDSVVGVSKAGIIVTADTTGTDIKKGDELQIDMKYKDIAFNTFGKVTDINGRIVKIGFTNVDKLTSTVMLFLSMFSENL